MPTRERRVKRPVAVTGSAHVGHLIRRALGSMSDAPPTSSQRALAAEVLTAPEMGLWDAMSGRDRRHSLVVLSRFDAAVPHAPRAARAAALLHDVGKIESDLGWLGRIAATVVGPRTDRFALYHRHEQIGADLLRDVSEPMTVRLVASHDDRDPLSVALRNADDV